MNAVAIIIFNSFDLRFNIAGIILKIRYEFPRKLTLYKRT